MCLISYIGIALRGDLFATSVDSEASNSAFTVQTVCTLHVSIVLGETVLEDTEYSPVPSKNWFLVIYFN